MTTLPEGWWKDDMIREEVQLRVRGLIREGFTNAEIRVKTGVNDSTVVRQRKLLGIPSHQIIELRTKRA